MKFETIVITGFWIIVFLIYRAYRFYVTYDEAEREYQAQKKFENKINKAKKKAEELEKDKMNGKGHYI